MSSSSLSVASGLSASAVLESLTKCRNCGKPVNWDSEERSLTSLPCGHTCCVACVLASIASVSSTSKGKATVRCFACSFEYVVPEKRMIVPNASLRALVLSASSAKAPAPIVATGSLHGGGGAGTASQMPMAAPPSLASIFHLQAHHPFGHGGFPPLPLVAPPLPPGGFGKGATDSESEEEDESKEDEENESEIGRTSSPSFYGSPAGAGKAAAAVTATTSPWVLILHLGDGKRLNLVVSAVVSLKKIFAAVAKKLSLEPGRVRLVWKGSELIQTHERRTVGELGLKDGDQLQFFQL